MVEKGKKFDEQAPELRDALCNFLTPKQQASEAAPSIMHAEHARLTSSSSNAEHFSSWFESSKWDNMGRRLRIALTLFGSRSTTVT